MSGTGPPVPQFLRMEVKREGRRLQSEEARRRARYRAATVHRAGLDESLAARHTPDDVRLMAESLKKKKGVDRPFLARLSQALAQSADCAKAFAAVDGASHALCTFLTGAFLRLDAQRNAMKRSVGTEDRHQSVEQHVSTIEFGYIIHGIYHPAAYIGHFRPEPNFYIIKSSGYIIQPSGYIGHFERCEREHLRT